LSYFIYCFRTRARFTLDSDPYLILEQFKYSCNESILFGSDFFFFFSPQHKDPLLRKLLLLLLRWWVPR